MQICRPDIARRMVVFRNRARRLIEHFAGQALARRLLFPVRSRVDLVPPAAARGLSNAFTEFEPHIRLTRRGVEIGSGIILAHGLSLWQR
jgi:hypothetical protein